MTKEKVLALAPGPELDSLGCPFEHGIMYRDMKY